jgi:crossover junction endodeoxyribonuclease RuvC
MIALGIDIGLSGALAVVRGEQLLDVQDMPTREKPGESLIRREVDARALYELILKMCGERSDETIAVCLENVYGMRKVQTGRTPGISGVFAFGDTRGAIRAVVEVMRLKPQWIAPVTWKRRFGLVKPKGEAQGEVDKSAARLKALELYPGADLQRVKDHNRAEAILIARFGWDMAA